MPAGSARLNWSSQLLNYVRYVLWAKGKFKIHWSWQQLQVEIGLYYTPGWEKCGCRHALFTLVVEVCLPVDCHCLSIQLSCCWQ